MKKQKVKIVIKENSSNKIKTLKEIYFINLVKKDLEEFSFLKENINNLEELKDFIEVELEAFKSELSKDIFKGHSFNKFKVLNILKENLNIS